MSRIRAAMRRCFGAAATQGGDIPEPVARQLERIDDVHALAAFFAASEAQPVLLFLSDPYCPISRQAAREITHVPGRIGVIDVSRGSALTQIVARRTGVRHQSPQVLLLDRQQATWSASHNQIRSAAVRRALETCSPQSAQNQ